MSLFAREKMMGKELSFFGKNSLEAVVRGEIINSIRRGDRTQGFYGYKKGMISPLVNSDKSEESLSFVDQIQSNKYGKVRFENVYVTKFQSLTDEQQKHLLKYYSWEKLREKDWTVTILKFEFVRENKL